MRHILLFVKLITFSFVSMGSINLASADEITPFIGHWEDSSYNCGVNIDERTQGGYLVISRVFNNNHIAEFIQGNYDTEGGGCTLNNPKRIGARVVLDGMCGAEELEKSPTQIELTKVYDDKHLVIKDLAYDYISLYTLCQRDADRWEFTSSKSSNKSVPRITDSRFDWLPQTYCDNKNPADADYVNLRECMETVKSCMGGAGERDCPAFKKCEYWRKGALISSGLCGLTYRVDDVGGVDSWIWESGNNTFISYDGQSEKYTWANYIAKFTIRIPNKECYEIRQTREMFCSIGF